MKSRNLGYLALGATVFFALAPFYRSGELPVRIHHLFHAAILVGAAVSGLLLSPRRQGSAAARALWLVVSVVAPILAMLLMWPSEYSPLDKLPAAHVLEHLGLVFFGFLTAMAGQEFAGGVGAAMSFSLCAMAFLAPFGFGVTPAPQVKTVSASSVTVAQGDVRHGHAVFQQNCSACHGARGEGGMGPSLINERSRKNLEQTVGWIKNPQPPMPKLYPSTLDEQAVRDVSAYVESLH